MPFAWMARMSRRHAPAVVSAGPKRNKRRAKIARASRKANR